MTERQAGMTLSRFEHQAASVPAQTASYLADIGEAKGKQELFKHQSPQILRALRENAVVESAVSGACLRTRVAPMGDG